MIHESDALRDLERMRKRTLNGMIFRSIANSEKREFFQRFTSKIDFIPQEEKDALAEKLFGSTPAIRSEFLASSEEIVSLLERSEQIREFLFTHGQPNTISEENSTVESGEFFYFESPGANVNATAYRSQLLPDEQTEAHYLTLDDSSNEDDTFLFSLGYNGSYGMYLEFKEDSLIFDYRHVGPDLSQMTDEEARIANYYLGAFIDTYVAPPRS